MYCRETRVCDPRLRFATPPGSFTIAYTDFYPICFIARDDARVNSPLAEGWPIGRGVEHQLYDLSFRSLWKGPWSPSSFGMTMIPFSHEGRHSTHPTPSQAWEGMMRTGSDNLSKIVVVDYR